MATRRPFIQDSDGLARLIPEGDTIDPSLLSSSFPPTRVFAGGTCGVPPYSGAVFHWPLALESGAVLKLGEGSVAVIR